MEYQYEVVGRVRDTTDWKKLGDGFTNKEEAIQFILRVLSKGYLGWAEASVCQTSSDTSPKEVANYIVDESGKIQSLEACQ